MISSSTQKSTRNSEINTCGFWRNTSYWGINTGLSRQNHHTKIKQMILLHFLALQHLKLKMIYHFWKTNLLFLCWNRVNPQNLRKQNQSMRKQKASLPMPHIHLIKEIEFFSCISSTKLKWTPLNLSTIKFKLLMILKLWICIKVFIT